MQEIPQNLETKVGTARTDVVSNMNSLRTGQLMDAIVKADTQLGFLETGKQVVLVERNHNYLEEMLGKVLPKLCPNYLVTFQEHSLSHYTVQDGRVQVYNNLDQASDIVKIKARVKHPDSIAEKVPRKAVYFGRVSEFHDNHKLMVGDIMGFEVVVKDAADVQKAVKKVLELPFLRLEHYGQHRKSNGYTSDHLNLIYENGNRAMRGLEVEVQVTDLNSHLNSINKPGERHGDYAIEKLESPHHMDGQLVIVGNSVKLPKSCDVKRVDGFLVSRIDNPIQPYTILVPTAE